MASLVRMLSDRWDRKNMQSLKRSLCMIKNDPELGEMFQKMEPHQQISTAERLVNMRKADITALRFYGLIFAGAAAAIKYLVWG